MSVLLRRLRGVRNVRLRCSGGLGGVLCEIRFRWIDCCGWFSGVCGMGGRGTKSSTECGSTPGNSTWADSLVRAVSHNCVSEKSIGKIMVSVEPYTDSMGSLFEAGDESGESDHSNAFGGNC